MPGDTSGSSDEELVNQIDELRARMDRLMQGGTSTSNSALLTEGPKQAQVVVPQPANEPVPERTRVRDLLGPVDKEEIESHQKAEDAVAFPEEDRAGRVQQTDHRSDERPPTLPPPSKPRQATVDGSLISVGDGNEQSRPRVSSFDDLGSVVEQELAKDASVPPATPRKGPDLASRFGPAEERVPAEARPESSPGPRVEEVEPDPEEEIPLAEEDAVAAVPSRRSHRGAVVAIWSFTGVVSATIAALHFTGVI